MPAVSFVSLGPGDPELITLKGFRKLQEAEVIFCPAGGPSSRAARILKALDIPEERILPFALPMGKDRRAAFQAYDRVYEQAAAASREGRKAVIVAEGDAGFYSSTQYICDRLAGNGIPVERTAGVPAFIAAGAVAGLHIVKQNEPLQVLPGEVDTAALLQSLERGVHTVIMKLPQSEAAVKACIRQAPRHGWHYFEHVGTGREFYTCDCETILQRPFPYFSLMLVLPDNPVR